MHFKESLWDDSDPTYAPCLNKIRGSFYWMAPKKYKKAGYSLKTQNLGGSPDDGLEYDRARSCRELTRDMVRWYEGETQREEAGTWGWLITRYLTDEYSAIHDVRPSTRETYKLQMAKIDNGIGKVLIEDTDFPRMMEWKRQMEANGRSTHYIKQWFTHFGLVLSHGIKLEVPRCAQLKAVRSEMRIKNPPRRQSYITRKQVEAVVEQLDADGFEYISLSVLFRFEFMLRGIDVYGEWTPIDGRTGGITADGRMWEGGLTWEMFDQQITRFQKVISKTQSSLPEPYTFDLTEVPHIRQRLLATPPAERVGPVIVVPGTMTPPKRGVVSRRFKGALKGAGLPLDLRISDARSGGITEAKSLVDPYQLRDAAQHSQITTTNTYVRGRSDAANNVVKLRQGGRK